MSTVVSSPPQFPQFVRASSPSTASKAAPVITNSALLPVHPLHSAGIKVRALIVSSHSLTVCVSLFLSICRTGALVPQTKSAAKKRFVITSSGGIKRKKCGK